MKEGLIGLNKGDILVPQKYKLRPKFGILRLKEKKKTYIILFPSKGPLKSEKNPQDFIPTLIISKVHRISFVGIFYGRIFHQIEDIAG